MWLSSFWTCSPGVGRHLAVSPGQLQDPWAVVLSWLHSTDEPVPGWYTWLCFSPSLYLFSPKLFSSLLSTTFYLLTSVKVSSIISPTLTQWHTRQLSLLLSAFCLWKMSDCLYFMTVRKCVLRVHSKICHPSSSRADDLMDSWVVFLKDSLKCQQQIELQPCSI